MKHRMKGCIKAFAAIISAGLIFFLWMAAYERKHRPEGVATYMMLSMGRDFARKTTFQRFPRDGGATEAEQIASLQKQWREAKPYSEDDPRSKYCDANIWAVVKNIPEDPPENLIILVTRNIDPSSLRTRLTDGDMQKQIQFDEQFIPPENLPILKKYAVVIRADGSWWMIFPKSKAMSRTYGKIYRGEPFDLTTNLVNGLQVKYLTTDGEVIPTND